MVHSVFCIPSLNLDLIFISDDYSSVCIQPVVGERIEELQSLQVALETVQQQMDDALLQKEKNEELMLRLKTENKKYKQS